MKSARPLLGGILTALLFIGLVLGVSLLSLAEGELQSAPSPSPTLPSPVVSLAATPTRAVSPTPLTLSLTPTASASLTFTPSGSPSPLPATPTRTPTRPAAACRIPYNWVPYIVQPGDTLYRISQAHGITVQQLQTGNCMTGTTIIAGQVLYVPPGGTRTPTPTFFIPSPWTNTPAGTLTETASPMPTDTPLPTDTPWPTDTLPSP